MRGRKPPPEAPAVRRGPSWGYLRSADAIRGPTCDNWNFNASNPCLYVGGNYNQNTNHGLFYVNYTSTSNTNTNIGCRNLFVITLILNFYGAGSRSPLGEDKQQRERVSTPFGALESPYS